MARFEVSQASVQRWPLPQGERVMNGVFLEVYLDQSKKTSCRFFGSKARMCRRFRTGPVEECDEMQWRTCNEEGFLVALLSFVMPRARAKKGEKLTLAVDAFRTSTNDIRGTHVASFRGVLCLGIWGPVKLQAVDGKGLDASLETAEVVLETRPTSSRPFSLECARPTEQPMNVEALFQAVAYRYSSEQAAGRKSLAIGRRSSRESVADGVRGRGVRLLRALARTGNRHERSRPPHQPAVDKRANATGNRRGSFTLTLSSTSTTTGSVDVAAPFVHRLSSDRSLPSSGGFTWATGRRLSNDRNSTGTGRQLSSDRSNAESGHAEASWRNLLGLAPSRRPQEAVATAFQQWIPQDWNSMWKGAWPLQLTGAAEEIEVVQLMEAEFRRDCIILFNTLFPRTQGSNFAALRQLALAVDSAPSKLQFRCASPKALSQRGSSRSSIDDSFDLDAYAARKNRRYSFSQRLLRRLSLTGGGGNRRSSTASEYRGAGTGLPPSEEQVSVSEDVASYNGGEAVVTNSENLGGFGPKPPAIAIYAPKEPEAEPRGPTSSINTSTIYRQSSPQDPPLPLLFVQNATGEVHSTSLHGNRILAQPSTPFIDEYSPRIMLLKRLLVSFAACGVYYSEAPNPAQLGDLWPYPIASLLGHGSRILIRLEDVEPSEFLNFLLTGDPLTADWKESGIPRPLQRRMAATHAVEITETGQLVERKLRVTNAAESVQNISDGIRKKHLGLSIPVGGVGNPSPLGPDHIIGFHGEVITRGSDMPAPSSNSLGALMRSAHRGSDISVGSGGSRHSSSDSSAASRCSGTEGWRVVSNVQGGHLYIRTDDFGEVDVPAGASGGSSSSAPGREEMRRALRERPTRDILPLEQARTKLKVESQTSEAGELFFPSSIARLRTPSRDDSSTVCGDNAGKMKLIRVRSAPNLQRRVTTASSVDVKWVHEAMLLRFAAPCHLSPPPSVTALRLLLEDYDPLNVQLFGSGRFKSIQDLYDELTERTSYIRWSDGRLERHCEPVILQLCWKGYVLMKTHEHVDGKDCPVQKTSFIATRLLPHEGWHMALSRIVESELTLPTVPFLESLEPSCQGDVDCHSVLQETTVSPSFPGLRSSYKTHMVRWIIREEAVGVFRSHGLPVADNDSIKGNLCSLGSDFITVKTVGGRRKIYWRWVPLMEAQKLQRFLNIGEATADERWARYAFQKEGAVQFPPTEAALAILLRRCGVDADAFGKAGRSTLHDLWLELTNEESHLQMSAGQPLRVVEATVLRLQWRPTSSDNYRVMVQVRSVKQHPPSLCRRLPSTHKRKEEAWVDSAVRLLVEDLALSLGTQQVRGLLASKAGDRTECDFREERTECEDFPGVECLRRTHLVTCTLREDAATSPVGRALGLRWPDEVPSEFFDGTRSGTSFTSFMRRQRVPSETLPPTPTSNATNKSEGQEPCFEWLDAAMLVGAGVLGSELWEAPAVAQERKRVASVLLGLEGSAPGMKSPFGVKHDASGKSAEISALGNRKWRCYRAHGALQIPSDVGGLRTCITRQMFEDLVETCERLDLCHPSADLAADPKQGHPRWFIDQRFAERELFKRLLAGSGREAREALAWIEEYRASHRTPGQAHGAMNGRRGSQCWRL